MRAPVQLLATLALGLGLWTATGRAVADDARAVARAIPVLVGSPDPAARAGAALLLGGVTDETAKARARVALAQALADPVPAVRRHVAVALARLPAAVLSGPLRAALAREQDAEVLPGLLLALGALKERVLVATLAGFGRHPSPSVRAAVLTALGETGGEEARALLLAALTEPGGPDPSWNVRSAAVLSLAHAGRPGDVTPVLEAMRATGGWSSWLARSALAKAAPTIDPAPLPLLERLAKDQDERVAVTAAEGYLRAGGPEAFLTLLAHPGDSVRAAAASACALAGVVEARPRLVALAYGDPSPRTRWSAALALFRLRLPEGDELVLAGLKSNEPAVWAEALVALEQATGGRHGTDVAAWRRELARRR